MNKIVLIAMVFFTSSFTAQKMLPFYGLVGKWETAI